MRACAFVSLKCARDAFRERERERAKEHFLAALSLPPHQNSTFFSVQRAARARVLCTYTHLCNKNTHMRSMKKNS